MGSTVRAGLLGRGIQESRSPPMHRAEGARLGFDYTYQLFDFDLLGLEDSDVPDLLARLASEGYAGLNVTHPFKERILACLDELAPDAAAIGAVNTVVFHNNRTIGHNTDCWGFAQSLRQGLSSPNLSDVVLLGAGGAGRAVARALFELGAHRVSVFDVEAAKAERLVAQMSGTVGVRTILRVLDLQPAVTQASGLVNATPVGMAKYPGTPVPPDWLGPELWVADIVYFPAETELLRQARRRGCQALPGAAMAIFQAVKAFELITGRAPDPECMARHFAEA
jgi:shikimate dehydrogenase